MTEEDVRVLIQACLPMAWCGTSAERMAEIIMPILAEVRAKALEDAADVLRDYAPATPTPTYDAAVEAWLRLRARAERGEQ